VSLCQPIEEGDEYELINSMIDEINAKCSLELSHEVSLYRPAITSEPDRPDFTDEVTERMVMVGGSHSSRLTDELDETCLEVMDISVRGWRLSEAAVEEKARELSEIVSSPDESRTTIVYQLFDNSSYYVKRPDGLRSLPGRGGDGKYHVDSKLEIATREETKRMVSTSIPLLRAAGKCRKVILTPSCRYRYSPCQRPLQQHEGLQLWKVDGGEAGGNAGHCPGLCENVKYQACNSYGVWPTHHSSSRAEQLSPRGGDLGGRPGPLYLKGIQSGCLGTGVSGIRETK
jgi:hypothetical protein